jgi:hypothetical protein
MTTTLKPATLKPAPPRYLDYIKEYARTYKEREARGEFIDLNIRNGQVMRFMDRNGKTWTVDAGPSEWGMKISRRFDKGERFDLFNNKEPAYSRVDVHKAYLLWLKGADEDELSIPGCTLVKGAEEKPRLNLVRKAQPKSVTLESVYDPSNPAGLLTNSKKVAKVTIPEVPAGERQMDWGDRPDYVPNQDQQAKRNEMLSVVLPMLQEKAYSMDTIASSTGYNRDYVRQISKQMFSADEHKENLKRKDS